MISETLEEPRDPAGLERPNSRLVFLRNLFRFDLPSLDGGRGSGSTGREYERSAAACGVGVGGFKNPVPLLLLRGGDRSRKLVPFCGSGGSDGGMTPCGGWLSVGREGRRGTRLMMTVGESSRLGGIERGAPVDPFLAFFCNSSWNFPAFLVFLLPNRQGKSANMASTTTASRTRRMSLPLPIAQPPLTFFPPLGQNPLIKPYLIGYNLLSLLGWSTILFLTIQFIINGPHVLPPVSTKSATGALSASGKARELVAGLGERFLGFSKSVGHLPSASSIAKHTATTATTATSKHHATTNPLASLIPANLALAIPAYLSGSYAYHSLGPLVVWTQTAALLEVVHALTGMVRSSVVTVGMQVASRVWMVWGVVEARPEVSFPRVPARSSRVVFANNNNNNSPPRDRHTPPPYSPP